MYNKTLLVIVNLIHIMYQENKPTPHMDNRVSIGLLKISIRKKFPNGKVVYFNRRLCLEFNYSIRDICDFKSGRDTSKLFAFLFQIKVSTRNNLYILPSHERNTFIPLDAISRDISLLLLCVNNKDENVININSLKQFTPFITAGILQWKADLPELHKIAKIESQKNDFIAWTGFKRLHTIHPTWINFAKLEFLVKYLKGHISDKKHKKIRRLAWLVHLHNTIPKRVPIKYIDENGTHHATTIPLFWIMYGNEHVFAPMMQMPKRTLVNILDTFIFCDANKNTINKSSPHKNNRKNARQITLHKRECILAITSPGPYRMIHKKGHGGNWHLMRGLFPLDREQINNKNDKISKNATSNTLRYKKGTITDWSVVKELLTYIEYDNENNISDDIVNEKNTQPIYNPILSITCDICLSKRSLHAFPKICQSNTCQKSICMDCVKSIYDLSIISPGNSIPRTVVKCPFCSGPVNTKISNRSEITLVKKIRKEGMYNYIFDNHKTTKVYVCPKKNCNGMSLIDKGRCVADEEQELTITNNDKLCTKCKNSMINVADIKDINLINAIQNADDSGFIYLSFPEEKKGDHKNDISNEEKTQKRYTQEQQKNRLCPTCHHLINRYEGCSHVECACGQHFCWCCGHPFDSADAVYDHLSIIYAPEVADGLLIDSYRPTDEHITSAHADGRVSSFDPRQCLI